VVSALLATSVTYLVYRRLKSSSTSRSTTQVVAAAADLPAGVTLAPKDLISVNWPVEVPLPGSFSKVEDVVGRPLIYSVGAKEPIFAHDLAAQGAGIGLTAKIPAGMRATAIRSNEIVGVAGFLYPGSHVDVLVTLTPLGSSGGPITQTVLQNVEVLTAGQTIEPDPQGKAQTVNVVTLLLSPEDSQKLQLASQQGSIQFVLRSGVDQTKVTIAATRMDQLYGGTPNPPQSSAGRANAGARTPKPVALKPPDVTIEVIQGTQKSVTKFQ